MIKPAELKKDLPVKLSNGVLTTTDKLWDLLTASHEGDIAKVESLVSECPEIAYAQFNYTPPIHFAVREGHLPLVQFLLSKGALDPTYKTYPFGDTLYTIAEERGYKEIAENIKDYLSHPERCQFRGDNGVEYVRSAEIEEFENLVAKGSYKKVEEILTNNPGIALDEARYWYEGILSMPANHQDRKMLDLLMQHGAKVPMMSKWGRAYYFKHFKTAKYLLENGMDAKHHTWHRVTLLHDMAQEGDVDKAELLITHGADINAIEEEYQSTPLGLASRWGHVEMVKFLLSKNADPKLSGAPWSTPLTWSEKREHDKISFLLEVAIAK